MQLVFGVKFWSVRVIFIENCIENRKISIKNHSRYLAIVSAGSFTKNVQPCFISLLTNIRTDVFNNYNQPVTRTNISLVLRIAPAVYDSNLDCFLINILFYKC